MMPGQVVDVGNGWMVELPELAITPTASRNGRAINTKNWVLRSGFATRTPA